MTTVLIVYETDYGNTKKMAESVAKGAQSIAGAEVILEEAEKVTAEMTEKCDALIIGSPVHMGSPDWRIKKFIDTVCSQLWMGDKMTGKIGGVFATGSGYGSAGGGCELTMLALLNNLAELGLLIVPLPKNTPGYEVGGLQWGPYARSAGIHMEQDGVTPEALIAAEHHGKHVASLAKKLEGQKIFE